MIIMKKSIPHGYTYGNFLEDFNIDIDIFEKFNETANIKKKLTTLLSGERTGALEQKKIKIRLFVNSWGGIFLNPAPLLFLPLFLCYD